MTITDLFKIYGYQESDLSKFCIIRHTPREMGDYLLDNRVFQFYQSVQDKGKFDKYTHIISFVATRENRTIFRGIYRIKSRNSLVEGDFRHLPLSIDLYEHYKTLIGKYDYYELEKDVIVNDMIGRLAIDWGGGELAWCQTYNIHKPKKVSEILPEGYFRDFVSYLDVSLSRSELEYLFGNLHGKSIWQAKLESVDGIYLIVHEGNGEQYIGSATGREGIWGRWQDYYKNPSGRNKLLTERINADHRFFYSFRYSILEVFPKNLSKSEVQRIEGRYKQKLGSRVFGLNAN